MKIGLVITCKNAWEYTRECLRSIRSEHELVVVVVDDGSTDHTKRGLRKWQSQDKAARWVFYDPPFESLAGKWNAGARKCWELGCDVVCVSNNDVLYHPGTLDALAARLTKGDVVMATASNVEGLFTATGVPPAFITSGQWELDPDITSEAEAPDFSCFMISVDCWVRVGEFDERYTPAYFEDNDYHERIIRLGLKAVALAYAPYYHYGSITRKHNPAPDEAKHRSFEETRHTFYRKWGFVPHGNAVLPTKLKLLIVGDGDRPTGFARVVHAIAERLHATGDYDIHHLAINYFGDPPNVPWKMYPAHLSNPPDMFGRHRLGALYDQLKPDAVLMVQDPWHITEYVRARAGMRGLTCYYPVDSPNVDPAWISFLARCVEVCTYTRFGARESARAAKLAFDTSLRQVVEAHGPGEYTIAGISLPATAPYHDPNVTLPVKRLRDLADESTYNVIPHGVDGTKFFRMDKEAARSQLGIPGRFVAGYAHRNQPRKRQDAMIRAWAKFVTGIRDADFGPDNVTEIRDAPIKIRDAVLVIHSPLDAMNGWDLPNLAAAYGIERHVWFTPPTQVAGSYSEPELNALMNSFDVNCNVGGGEGWGLSHFESGICGVAQLVPDWSATKEVWEGNAELVRVAEVHHSDHGLNTAQAVVDTDAVADALLRMYEDPAYLAELGGKARALVSRPCYSWDSVAAEFDRVLKRAARLKGVPEVTMTIKASGKAA